MQYNPGLLTGQLPMQNGMIQDQTQFNSVNDFLASPQFMALAAGLLSQAGPSKEPVSLGKGLALGMQGMQAAAQQNLDNQIKKADFNMRAQEFKYGLADKQAERALKEKTLGLNTQELAMKEAKFRQDMLAEQELNNRINAILGGGDITQSINTAPTASTGVSASTSTPSISTNTMPSNPIAGTGATPQDQSQKPQIQSNWADGLSPEEKQIAALMLYKKDFSGFSNLIGQNKLKPTDITNIEGKLRDDYTSASKDYKNISDSYAKILKAGENPSAAGDLSLIFGYMKILDPSSVVREGEFATAQNAAGVPDRIKAMYNKVMTGERLTADVRQDFLNQAKNLYTSQADLQKGRSKQFRDIAARNRVNPDNVVIDFGLPEAMSMTPTQAQTQVQVQNNNQQQKILRYNPATRRVE